jgi:uncharacterized protein (TIGR03067 family)
MAHDVSGTWHGVYCEVDGEIIPPAYVASLEAKYEKGEFSIKVQGKVEHEGTYTIDDKKEPAQITFVYTKSSRFETGKPRVGIFQITGGTYKNCLGQVGSKAPSAFNTTARSNTVLTVLQKGGASKSGIVADVGTDTGTRLLAW